MPKRTMKTTRQHNRVILIFVILNFSGLAQDPIYINKRFPTTGNEK